MDTTNNSKQKMSDEALKARRQYLNDWRKKNPDKRKRYEQTYWEKKARAAMAAEADSGETAERIMNDPVVVLPIRGRRRQDGNKNGDRDA